MGAAIARALANRVVAVWPENWPVFQLFARVRTQWAVGMGGASGLRYEAVYPLLDRMNLSPQEWDEALEDIQAMEFAAMAANE